MKLRRAFASNQRVQVRTHGLSSSAGNMPAGRGRRVRAWLSASSVVALLLMGAAPALAEEGALVDPAAATVAAPADSQTLTAESVPPPAEPEPPAPVEVVTPSAPDETVPTDTTVPTDATVTPAPSDGTEPAADASASGNGDGSGAGLTTSGANQRSVRVASETVPADEPPFIRWTVTDDAGQAVSPVTFTVQGPRDDSVADDGADARWQKATTSTVIDNVGAEGYVGLDRDPQAGTFLLKQLIADADLNSVHPIVAGENYRVRPAEAAGFLVGDAATWLHLATLDDATAVESAMAQPDKYTLEVTVTGVDDSELTDASGIGDIGTLSVDEPEDLGTPYVYWNIERADGTPLAGATFQIAAGTGSSTWGNSVNVTDCVAVAPVTCTGIDLDPDPGEFQVQFLGANSTTPVVAGNRYRVTQSVIPNGFLADSVRGSGSSGWQQVASGAWNEGAGVDTHNFGSWVNLTTLASGTARIVVKTGGDRTGAASVAGLSGVVLHLRSGNSNGPSSNRADGVSGDGAGWARCMSDANGDCAFVVPNTGNGGSNRDDQFWVVEYSVPTHWYMNGSLRTGGSAGAGSSDTYQFRTGDRLRSGNTYTSSSNFMSTESGDTASSGIWQQSRENPTFPGTCGVDVALVLDLSGSVGSSVTQLKSAANAFTDALVGTQSRMALFTFAYVSPKSGTSNYPTLVPVATQDQANTFKSRYTNWTADGGTNWDRGLAVPAANNSGSNHYEVVVVITDGNPTNYGTSPSGSGQDNRFIEAEQGIFSANQLKAQGSRILVFGVGDGATGATNALNLKAISGPTVYNGSNARTADYYQTADYDAVGTQLKALAQGSCANNMTVTKKVVPNTAPDGSITGAAPAAAGWQFTASDPGDGLGIPSPVQTTTSDGTGTVTFPLAFDTGVTSGPLTVTETQQSGYSLVPVPGTGGKNAVCTNTVTGANVDVTNVGSLGFRLTAPSATLVNCVVYNRAPSLTSTVTVNKTWVINDGSGTPITIDGNTGELPEGLSAQLKLSKPTDTATMDNWPWGLVRPNYPQNSTAKIGEVVTINGQLLPGCTITSQMVTAWDREPGFTPVSIKTDPLSAALFPGANIFAVTNTVTCGQTLELVKVVDFGGESAATWTLSGSSLTPGVLPGPSGHYTLPASVKSPVTQGEPYSLAETGGPATYVPTLAGWACVRQNGQSLLLNSDGAIVVPLGQDVKCTVHNTTAKLTVFKDVEGGSATPNLWDISGQPAATPPVPGLGAAIWYGASSPAAGPPSGGTTVEIRPNHNYTLSEALSSAAAGAPLAYLLQKVQTWDPDAGSAGEWVDVPNGELNSVTASVNPGQHEYYRFVNTAAPAVAIPFTGGLSSDAFGIGGISVAILAGILGVMYWRRQRWQAEAR